MTVRSFPTDNLFTFIGVAGDPSVSSTALRRVRRCA